MCFGAVKARARVYRSIDELSEVLEPSRYIIRGIEIVAMSPWRWRS